MEKDIWVYGRPYVEEDDIDAQQYHDFFDNTEYTISFTTANFILANPGTECVPCDQLNEPAREQIRDCVLAGELDGEIEPFNVLGDYIHWKWEPEVVIDGQEGSIEDLDEVSLDRVIFCMLEDGSHSVNCTQAE